MHHCNATKFSSNKMALVSVRAMTPKGIRTLYLNSKNEESSNLFFSSVAGLLFESAQDANNFIDKNMNAIMNIPEIDYQEIQVIEFEKTGNGFSWV